MDAGKLGYSATKAKPPYAAMLANLRKNHLNAELD
jgi:hypothetical protein